jgi:hypothetical protein
MTNLTKETVMKSITTERGVEHAGARAPEAAKDARGAARAYEAPELHVIGKAGELVQGGGGNYADNNRSRQY